MIHISTDYVFDGLKETPYIESDELLPFGHYGQTKLDGEVAALNASPRYVVARVSWVFGLDRPSFVDMIVDRAITNEHVEAVADKTSSPTSAEDAVDWLEAFISPETAGVFFASAMLARAPGRNMASMPSIARASHSKPRRWAQSPSPH